jgi:hypothetical protein
MAATNYAKSVHGRQRKPGTMDRREYQQRARELALRGQELNHAKLMELDVIDIRSAHRQRLNLLQYIRDNLSNEALAKRHNVGVSTIEKIVTYKTWGHVA